MKICPQKFVGEHWEAQRCMFPQTTLYSLIFLLGHLRGRISSLNYIYLGISCGIFLLEHHRGRISSLNYIYRGISCGRVSTPHMTTFTSILLTQSIYRWRHNGFRELCQSLIIFIGTPQRANFLFELYMSRYIMW